jgi:hypothetical protein
LIAGQEARVEQRRLHLHILAGELDAVAHVAQRVADRQPGVPQRVQHLLRHRLDEGVGPLRVEDEQVDVGGRVELGAPVAALGDEGDALIEHGIALGVAGARGLVEDLHHPVDHRRPGGHDRPTRCAFLMADEEQLARPPEVVARLAAPGPVEHERTEGVEHGPRGLCPRLGNSRHHRSGNTPHSPLPAQVPFPPSPSPNPIPIPRDLLGGLTVRTRVGSFSFGIGFGFGLGLEGENGIGG